MGDSSEMGWQSGGADRREIGTIVGEINEEELSTGKTECAIDNKPGMMKNVRLQDMTFVVVFILTVSSFLPTTASIAQSDESEINKILAICAPTGNGQIPSLPWTERSDWINVKAMSNRLPKAMERLTTL